MKVNKLDLQKKIFDIIIILGSIEAVAILYNGVLCLETQRSVFDIEAHVIIPLGIIAILLRQQEALTKVHHRKLCLMLYVLLVLVSIVGFIATIITNQNEDIIYSFGEMLAVVGVILYDITTSKTLERLY